MKNINDIRADILAAILAAETDEAETLNKSAKDTLAEAVQNYLTASTATTTLSTTNEPAKKAGKNIKEKGIALCHQAQGYSANLRPVSLMMKASLDELTPEQLAALGRLGYAINQEA